MIRSLIILLLVVASDRLTFHETIIMTALVDTQGRNQEFYIHSFHINSYKWLSSTLAQSRSYLSNWPCLSWESIHDT